MKRAVILAGGQATRLGPLAAQLNKAMVSVRQRPILVHHALNFYNLGYREVYVVANPDAIRQLQGVVDRSLRLPGLVVSFIPQDAPLGPGHAIATAIRAMGGDDPVLITMADTYVDIEDIEDTGDWVGTKNTDQRRNWCVREDDHSFVERVPTYGETVKACVGLYRFSSGSRLLTAANAACRGVADGEVLMAPLLNNYDQDRQLADYEITSWQDVGDIAALAKARRERFNSRTFNELNMDSLGVVTKRGSGPGFEAEARFMESISKSTPQNLLFPRYIGGLTDKTMYQMEFVDLPTLGELYLYWPARPELWAHILNNVVSVCDATLWKLSSAYDVSDRAEKIYNTKMLDRFESMEGDISSRETLTINGKLYLAGERLIEQLSEYVKINVLPNVKGGTIHGDLNFTNILYSLGSDTFKLVDPRGEWGGHTALGDIQYEFAKLRYSYAGFFPAIVQHLWAYQRTNSDVQLDFGLRRDNEIAAMDEVIWGKGMKFDSIRAIEATLFISGAPLHPGREGEVMYLQGIKIANEVLNA